MCYAVTCLTSVLSSGQNFGREWHQGGHRGGRQNYGPPNNHGSKVTMLDFYLL